MFSFIKTACCSLAIDLGTSNTLVYKKNEGIIYNEPTCISIDSKSRKLIRIGQASKDMDGKSPQNIQVIHPLRQGAISDLQAAKMFLHHLVSNSIGFNIKKPNIAISIPFDLNQVERKAVYEAAVEAGAKDVFLIEDPYSAAIGSGIDLKDTKGNLILDIGGGVSEVSLLANGGVVSSASKRVGGETLDKAIINYFKNQKLIGLSLSNAEAIKKEFGFKNLQNQSLIVHTKSLSTRMPVQTAVNSHEVYEAILPVLESIKSLVYGFISTMPVDFATDIYEKGIILTGGSSMVYDLDKYLKEHLNLDTSYSCDPLLDIVTGAGKILEDRRYNDFLKTLAA